MRVLVISPNFFDYPQVICEQLGKLFDEECKI